MRLHKNISAVATALLTAVSLVSVTGAQAHPPRFFFFNHHFIPTPPPVQAAPPLDNVRDFGAKGDGTTDDTAAINKAVTDAKATGKTVFFPGGTYFHAGTLTFDGVKVTGVGYGSTLKANTAGSAEENTAVILKGASPSLTNLIVSCVGVNDNDDGFPESTEGCVVVDTATGFTVKNCTLVQGNGMPAVFVTNSSTGSVSANSIDGTGGSQDTGVWVNGSQSITVSNNLMQNENVGVRLTGSTLGVAVTSNSIGTVTFPALSAGVWVDNGIVGANISKNAIQMRNATQANPNYSIYLNGPTGVTTIQNNTWGGWIGVYAQTFGTGDAISQNLIHNTGSAGIRVDSAAANALAVNLNQFGECGLLDNSASSAVILANAGSSANLANVTVTNNSYQGHANNLKFYVNGHGGAGHLAGANVTGNTQTQTSLANQL